MPSKEQYFSPAESLKLIQSMIDKTKNSISDKSHYFLLWGWAIFIGCVLQYWLKVIVNWPQHYYAWLITPVALVVHFYFTLRDKRKEKVQTYIGEAFRYLWISIGSSFMVLAFIFSHIGWQYCYPFYILFYAIGTYVSGSLIKFKPLKYGGLVCFPLAAVAELLSSDDQILILALAVMLSYIIPGYLLRQQYKKQLKHNG
ncbi:MAG TPA: hypothetical protein PKM63_18785 [Panacibacter sp.]|nr:hypothetical protein [Panacibacter sp.]HNP46348.1 hypothetical protein [Panacibacter sp.]